MKKNIVIVVAMAALMIVAIFGMNQKINNDAIKFKNEYEELNGKTNDNNKEYLKVEINSDNPMIYATYKEIMNLLDDGTGIVYFGFPECPWCRNAVPVLLDSAKELGIDKIYYFNALDMRDKKHLDENGNIVVDEEGTEEYKKLVQRLYEVLPVYDGLNDETIKRLYFPTVVFVKDGNIIGLHTSTVDSQEDPYAGLTDDEYNELKQIYSVYINETYDILCDQSC